MTSATAGKSFTHYLGLEGLGEEFYQLPAAKLVEDALAKGEGKLAENGSLVVETGKYTGRSPNDRFFVDSPATHNTIDWGTTNKPISPETFDSVFEEFKAFLKGKNVYVFDGYAGADERYSLKVRFINTFASQNLFVHQLFIRPTDAQLKTFSPEFTVICCPNLKLDPVKHPGLNSEAAVLVNIEKKMVLVAATRYSGEMKKSIFTTLNFMMPERNVFPMHCSANVGEDGKSALFFGLSGTGKTTLSADPERTLIGDDEHGWSDTGIFNFEGGCYAKAIKLSKKNEPEIWDAIRFGALVENVVIDPATRVPNYDDASLTENTRVGYPIHYIPNASETGIAPHPSTVIFLTADAFGVMPPIAKLTQEQAQYHFISGYTSKLAGTERGITEPQAVFSTCFGAPFMPRPSAVYAQLLKERIEKHNVNVYLINTGWQGGPYGVGERVSIPHTRAMVHAALNGDLEKAAFETHPVFNVLVPKACPGVPSEILNPRDSWQDKAAYDAQATKLATMFVENFKKFSGVAHLVAAGPKVAISA